MWGILMEPMNSEVGPDVRPSCGSEGPWWCGRDQSPFGMGIPTHHQQSNCTESLFSQAKGCMQNAPQQAELVFQN